MKKPGPSRKIIAVIISLSLLSIALISAIIIALIIEPEVELGRIEINIADEKCQVQAELEYSPSVRIENEELDVVLEDQNLPVNMSSKGAGIELNERQFREIMEKEEIRIKGSADAYPLPFWRSSRSIDQTVDLSFISDLVDSIEISDIEIDRSEGTGLLMIFNLSADIEQDVSIIIENTYAVMRAGSSEHDLFVRELDIKSGGIGSGKIEMGSLAFLAAALYSSDLEIDAWGIVVDLELPIDL